MFKIFSNNNRPEAESRLSSESGAGFIALISTIIISVLLLAITVVLGFSAFFNRFNILDSESKERGLALAEACVDTAVLNLAQGISTTGSVPVGTDHCNIVSVTPQGSNTLIQTQGCINKSITNLKVIVDSSFVVTSWKEVPNLSPNTPCI